MAKYLRTSGISSGIDELIREAKERLYIISPYLKLSDSIKELLNDKEREKVEVRIIFGKQELNPSEMGYLQSLKYVRLFFSKNLHAKCYLNEKKMIITSMNLYEFSQQNNREMGVLIDRVSETDKQIYEDAWKDIESIMHNADDFAYVKAPKESEHKPIAVEKGLKKSEKIKDSGYCIRTGVEIPFNVDKPFSADAYKKWNEYSNPDFKEKFCHFSGEDSKGETSMKKPILNKNWKRAKEKYNL